MLKRLRYLRQLLRESLEFAAANKAWWLAPILIILLAIGAIIVVGGGAATPLIYTLF